MSRAFLGVRLDCAQCHDHPFQPWKQADFRGLAAFFGGVRSDLRGIRDARERLPAARPQGQGTRPGRAPRAVPPRVAARPGHAPRAARRLGHRPAGTRTSPGRRSNRVWALLFGRPLVEPVDDLAAAAEIHPALIALADDFSSHGYDLHRLIRIIAATEAFRLDSARRRQADEAHDAAWAVFPMTRLRPEQVAGALFQAARSRRSAPNPTGSPGWSPTPAATTSSDATATWARTSSTPGAGRSPSACC